MGHDELFAGDISARLRFYMVWKKHQSFILSLSFLLGIQRCLSYLVDGG